MANVKFWLYDWIDTFEIKERKDAEVLLADPGIIRGLRKRLEGIPFTTEELEAGEGPTIIAGQAIDLSGQLDCFHWNCLKKQVDGLFSRVWHYFDRIVVVGPSAHQFARNLDADGSPTSIERLLTYIELLLYIRRIGAEELLIFRQKRPPCEHHFDDHMREVGLDPNAMLSDQVIEGFIHSAKISVKPHQDHLDYTFIHKDFEHTVWGSIPDVDQQAQGRLVTASVLKKYLSSLASDIYTARALNSPLGTTINVHVQLLKTIKSGLSDGEVAFNLELPILKNIAPEDLLKVRREQRIHFENFRNNLRLAIQERLKSSDSPNARTLAAEIQRDLIDPEISNIELRLNGARQSVAKKTGLSIGLGALSMTYGLLSANPVVVTAGVTAVLGGTLTAGQKFIEERRDITLSDMYFLWQAAGHASH